MKKNFLTKTVKYIFITIISGVIGYYTNTFLNKDNNNVDYSITGGKLYEDRNNFRFSVNANSKDNFIFNDSLKLNLKLNDGHINNMFLAYSPKNNATIKFKDINPVKLVPYNDKLTLLHKFYYLNQKIYFTDKKNQTFKYLYLISIDKNKNTETYLLVLHLSSKIKAVPISPSSMYSNVTVGTNPTALGISLLNEHQILQAHDRQKLALTDGSYIKLNKEHIATDLGNVKKYISDIQLK